MTGRGWFEMRAKTSAGPNGISYVAFLRGINVGGNNVVSMKSLKASFERLRFRDVSTYINSGNVLFRTADRDVRAVERRIDRMLAREYELNGRTVVRSSSEMARLVEAIEATWKIDARWRYNVIFLRHEIDSDRVLAELKPRPDIERVVYCPGTLLWSARIDALTRTDMLKLAARGIYRQMTVRNVNTTTKVFQLLRRMDEAPG